MTDLSVNNRSKRSTIKYYAENSHNHDMQANTKNVSGNND